MKVAIVKYNAGNIQSVMYALQRLGIEPVLTDDHETLKSADKVIFPGVGEASSAMNYLRKVGLDQLLPTLKQDFLGVCIGLQLMCAYSEEGNTDCLNIFSVDVKKFPSTSSAGDHFKVPHMGWNNLESLQTPLFENIDPAHAYVYYVHSFYAALSDCTIATTPYSVPFFSRIA